MIRAMAEGGKRTMKRNFSELEDEDGVKIQKIRIAHQLETSSTWDSAFEAVKLWGERPNLVNRRLCGCSIFWSKTKSCSSKSNKNLVINEIIKDVAENLSANYAGNACFFKELTEILSDFFALVFQELDAAAGSEEPDKKASLENAIIDLYLRKLLPRSMKKFDVTIELVISLSFRNSDNRKSSTWFVPLFHLKENQPSTSLDAEMKSSFLLPLSYGIRYLQHSDQKGSLELLVLDEFQEGCSPSGILCANLEWLKETLMKKLKNWAESFAKEKQNLGGKRLQSLSLVDVEEYSKVYNQLKEKYAKSLCEAWEENTDPKKFVFEDISIAAYLIVLWCEERRKCNLKDKQSFVDLGCGNGLLVYLLTKEGYRGQGVDLRRRNIWNSFGKDTVLLEQPLHPNSCKFEDADWLIGNHSDELTPWIPVIAARSSYRTKYFLLPCCFHDFTRKFQKNCHNSSQYQTYLEYVREIGEACGFVIEEDIQRIPSTKRTCHIARNRTYELKLQSTIDNKIHNFLTEQGCHLTLGDSSSDKSKQEPSNENSCSSQFEPREAKEVVKNCTQIDKQIRDDIVKMVSNALLESGEKLDCGGDYTTSKGFSCSDWNSGGVISLESLASILSTEQLQKLKSQCGGLQTLIRNHGYIFRVIEGHVRLRNYKTPDDKQSKRGKKAGKPKTRNHYKVKPCWFHHHHPQGCLLASSECQFVHDESTECNDIT